MKRVENVVHTLKEHESSNVLHCYIIFVYTVGPLRGAVPKSVVYLYSAVEIPCLGVGLRWCDTALQRYGTYLVRLSAFFDLL